MDSLSFLKYLYLPEIVLFYTACPLSSDPFYIVSYYTKWVSTSWTYSNSFCIQCRLRTLKNNFCFNG